MEKGERKSGGHLSRGFRQGEKMNMPGKCSRIAGW